MTYRYMRIGNRPSSNGTLHGKFDFFTEFTDKCDAYLVEREPFSKICLELVI